MHPAAAAAHLLATNTQPTVTALRASHDFQPSRLSSIRPTIPWGGGLGAPRAFSQFLLNTIKTRPMQHSRDDAVKGLDEQELQQSCCSQQ